MIRKSLREAATQLSTQDAQTPMSTMDDPGLHRPAEKGDARTSDSSPATRCGDSVYLSSRVLSFVSCKFIPAD